MTRSSLLSRLVLCAAIGFAGGAATAAVPSPHAIELPKWFTESFLDFREDIADAKGQGKRLMLYFGQDGCPYCQALMKTHFGDPAIAAATQRRFVAVALNIWGDREVTWLDGKKMSEKQLAALLRVQFTPTLLFLDESGRTALRVNGYWPPDRFKLALDYAGGPNAGRLSFADHIAGRAPPEPLGKLMAESFFATGQADLAALVRKRGKPLLAVFEQKSCRECEELHRDALQHAEVRARLAKFTAVQIDIFGEEKLVTPAGTHTTAKDWSRDLQVVHAPSLVFFDGAGKEVFRVEGILRAFHVESALDYVASGAYRREPSFQRFIRARADRLRASGRAVVLW